LSLASIVSAGSKLSNSEDAKRASYHVSNDVAPSQAACKYLSQLSTATSVSPAELMAATSNWQRIPQEKFVPIVKTVNSLVPQFKIEDKRQSPLLLLAEKNSIKYKKILPTIVEMKGNYSAISNVIDTFSMGLGNPAMKRIARNAWTGTPTSELKLDHIVALHDAGVKVGDAVVVNSSDADLIALLRATFGTRIHGVGSGLMRVTQHNLWRYKWDYVYYPEPMKMNPTGSADNNMEAVRTTVNKYFNLAVDAKLIMHVSPLLFYYKDFCKLLDIKYGENLDDLPLTSVVLERAQQQGAVCKCKEKTAAGESLVLNEIDPKNPNLKNHWQSGSLRKDNMKY